MQILINRHRAPIAGATYIFGVANDAGEARVPIHVSVVVGGDVIFDGNCPDPPCHQMSVFIDRRYANLEMRIEAVTEIGQRKVAVMRIGSPESISGSSITSSA